METCKHEWVRPQPNLRETWNLRECVKCGKHGKLLKCRTCDTYTVHEYVSNEFKGAEDANRNSRDVTTWKCTVCGTIKKTVQVWGYKAGWGMAHG
jgi:hypothetical protein